ncbi:MAG TPA: sigma-54 dependent transcriptional regulator [Polyangiaceae bacterium]|nr:sigma-54 dependent transcriptional regulator [Polyangiaceae bacterium]
MSAPRRAPPEPAPPGPSDHFPAAGRRRVLLIDDDPDVASGVALLLEQGSAYAVRHAPTAALARAALRDEPFDAVLVDLGLPDGDGLRLVEEIAAAPAAGAVLCLTARDDASAAVRALRAGACDYLTKPARRAELLGALEAATALAGAGRPAPGGDDGLPVGDSPAWRHALGLLRAAARSPRTTVLFTGEPGVGKEEAASLLHRLGAGPARPFVTVNAACLTPSLVESELFGHEAGAFTGALRQRRGVFERAEGGTLFLDEIGELPLDLQPKLLRVLEGHPFCRLGGERPLAPDLRVVCATNRPLAERVREGRFRADLYERLRVFEVALPPLRDRPGDVRRLATHFLAKLAPRTGRPPGGISPAALEALEAHAWPGNVRELRNAIERALVLADGQRVEPRHLPPGLRPAPPAPPASPVPPAPAGPPRGAPRDALEDVVRAHITAVYESTGGNVTRTAERLLMSRLALRKRLRAYGLRAGT